MSWLWSSSKSTQDKDKNADETEKDSKKAFSSLDPSLKDYFQHLTPEGKPTVPVPEPERLPDPTIVSPEDRSKPRERKPIQYAEASPKHSLSAYGDRYAEYWQTYTGAGAHGGGIRHESGDQKMKDFAAGLRQLKDNISKAARENCVFEELELTNCYKNGSWWQTMRMCSAENFRLQSCMEQQVDFLKAMGYLLDPTRDPAVDERIQMHADKLYQQQKALDEAADLARKEGRNVEDAVAKVRTMQAQQPTPDYTKAVKVEK